MLDSVALVFINDPVWQILGILWMITVIYAFLQKDDLTVIKILFISSFFWIWHFFFLEAYSAMISTLIWAVRLALSIKYKKNIKVFYVLIFITLILWFWTYDTFSSLIPIIASCLATYGFFFLEKIKLRLLLLISSSFWLSYNYIHFSVWWVLNETILLFVHIYIIYKIIEVEWTKTYYIEKINSIIRREKPIDYWRYLSIIDYIKMKKKSYKIISFFKNIKIWFNKK